MIKPHPLSRPGRRNADATLPSPPAGKVPSRRKFTGMAQRKNATADEVANPRRRAPFTSKHNLAFRAQSIADRRYGRFFIGCAALGKLHKKSTRKFYIGSAEISQRALTLFPQSRYNYICISVSLPSGQASSL